MPIELYRRTGSGQRTRLFAYHAAYPRRFIPRSALLFINPLQQDIHCGLGTSCPWMIDKKYNDHALP